MSSRWSNAIIGAGAIVTKDIPPKAIVAGNPAKVIRYGGERELSLAGSKK